MKYYPAFLDLKGKNVVVVGGGKVAERKARLLLKAGAEVKVISPELTVALKKMAKQGLLCHVKRNYRKGDLKDSYLVVAGTSSKDINSRVAKDAAFLVNVIDAPGEGNFIVPSTVKRGPLTFAISTEGTSPAIARAIREEIESSYTKDFARYLEFAEHIRGKAISKISDPVKREAFLKSLASEEVLGKLRKKGFSSLKKKILDSLGKV